LNLRGSTILVTGGTGSFGNRVVRALMNEGPEEIRVFSRDEKKQWEMRRVFPDLNYIVGDVRDVRKLTLATRGADLVFHAAALKQVPSCEQYPDEAVQTNVLGSQNVCDVARACGVRRVIALSTDKAVKPINAMGISKAMMEKIVSAQNLIPSDTVFSCVRYGNVMNSRGSVIPLFRDLIDSNQPLTVTVPHMTRFLMTLEQSVGLVLHAMTSAEGGEIFVRKAPACTVIDLARAMCLKYSPLGANHPIEVVGIRPGEKIHEVLVSEHEILKATEDEEFITVHPEYRRPPTIQSREDGYEYTSENTRQMTDSDEISRLLDQADNADSFT